MSVYYLGSSIIERCDCGETNIGKGGLKSSEIKSYYKGVNVKGSIVVLYIGSNDIRNDEDEKAIYKNIVNFIESIVSEVKKIIYVGILKEPLTKNKKAIDYVNNRMREYAKKHNKVYTVNVNREIKSEDYLEDNVHLNEEGNKKLKRKIKEVM